MLKRTLIAASIAAVTCTAHAEKPKNIGLTPLGTHLTGIFDEGAAEIVAYDPAGQDLYVINADAKTVDILDISDPTSPTFVDSINVSGDLPLSGGVNSVAVHDGIVAVAVENGDKQANGWAAFYSVDGTFLGSVVAGALPDMITFTHNGQYALVANEGEPSDDYSVDPEGSVTVIDLRNGVASATAVTAGFGYFDLAYINGLDGARTPRAAEVPPAATVAQDLEPEYITTSFDSSTAWVALQENNAVAVVDIKSATVTAIVGLGKKDHSLEGNELDASNKDDAINITNWPVLGTYMPDTIASFRLKGKTYLVTANEGDGREYVYETTFQHCTDAGHIWDGDDEAAPGDEDDCISYIDETRVKDVMLNPAVFTDESLQDEENLGRLKIIATEGDLNGDGEYEELHSFGARSISIWDAAGMQVSDTGSTMEEETAAATLFCGGDLEDCSGFNSTNDENDSFDNRSDDKGPEPEGVVVGKVRGVPYAFVGLERVGGIMIFDLSDPSEPRYVSYFNNRDFDPTLKEVAIEDEDVNLLGVAVEEGEDVGDFGPEGLVFIKPEDSPNGQPLLVVGNEVSGTTTVYQITY